MERKDLLELSNYLVLATQSSGTPWNSPLFFAVAGQQFYWISSKESRHSRNIKENPKVFIVVFDSHAIPGAAEGLYCEALAEELEGKEEIGQAVRALAQRLGQNLHPPEHYLGDSLARIYKATPVRAWINGVERKGDASVDVRHPVGF